MDVTWLLTLFLSCSQWEQFWCFSIVVTAMWNTQNLNSAKIPDLQELIQAAGKSRSLLFQRLTLQDREYTNHNVEMESDVTDILLIAKKYQEHYKHLSQTISGLDLGRYVKFFFEISILVDNAMINFSDRMNDWKVSVCSLYECMQLTNIWRWRTQTCHR